MIAMKELREEIKKSIYTMEQFTTLQLKEKLKEKGYTYNVDYDVTAFSNAISSLVRKNCIAPLDSEKKGNYRVINKVISANIKNEENTMRKIEDVQENNEIELRKMREDIKVCLNSSCLKIEQILDSEKPSTYGRNRKTYDDILQLIELLKNFKFTVEE